MTREEAKREILFAKREVMADSWIDKAYDVAIKALEEQPKKGRWITKSTNGEMFDSCSVCGYVEWDVPRNYCPNCGADMRCEAE